MCSIPAERLQDRRTKTRWKIESFDRRVWRLFTVVVVCRAFQGLSAVEGGSSDRHWAVYGLRCCCTVHCYRISHF
jgi:hypothetical protein